METPDFLVGAMEECILLAKKAAAIGQYPLGSVITSKTGILIGRHSELISGCDPTAHPEMVVIRKAAEILSSRYLPDLYLVSTLEPCPMCTSAAIWAKMAGIAYGTSQNTAKEWGRKLIDPLYTFRQIDIECQYVAAKGDPVIEVFSGVLESECDSLLDLVG